MPNITLMNAKLILPVDTLSSKKSTAGDSSKLLPILFNSIKSKSFQFKWKTKRIRKEELLLNHSDFHFQLLTNP